MRTLGADIKKTYPQLGDVAVDFAWSGTLGNSIHRMPQIGELAPGLWLASGFGGHGLNTTAIAGTLIARAIIDGDQTWRQFTPFELVWAGGILGRATAQIYYWMRRCAMPSPSAAAARRSWHVGVAVTQKQLARRCSSNPAADAGSIVPPADLQTDADADLTQPAGVANRPRRRKRRQGAKA